MRVLLLSLLAFAAALPAAAQTPPPRDEIGALLDRSASPPNNQPPLTPQPLTPQTAAPAPYRPAPSPQLSAPVHIDETGKTPDAPLTPRDMAYDSRIRSSFASAESFQGPLDGGWTLSANGQDLYALQLVDRRDRLEGVWRDVRRKGSLNASGLVEDLQRQGSELTLRFTPSPGAPTAVATLHDSTGGLWTGDLTEGAAHRAVTLRRTGP